MVCMISGTKQKWTTAALHLQKKASVKYFVKRNHPSRCNCGQHVCLFTSSMLRNGQNYGPILSHGQRLMVNLDGQGLGGKKKTVLEERVQGGLGKRYMAAPLKEHSVWKMCLSQVSVYRKASTAEGLLSNQANRITNLWMSDSFSSHNNASAIDQVEAAVVVEAEAVHGCSSKDFSRRLTSLLPKLSS